MCVSVCVSDLQLHFSSFACAPRLPHINRGDLGAAAPDIPQHSSTGFASRAHLLQRERERWLLLLLAVVATPTKWTAREGGSVGEVRMTTEADISVHTTVQGSAPARGLGLLKMMVFSREQGMWTNHVERAQAMRHRRSRSAAAAHRPTAGRPAPAHPSCRCHSADASLLLPSGLKGANRERSQCSAMSRRASDALRRSRQSRQYPSRQSRHQREQGGTHLRGRVRGHRWLELHGAAAQGSPACGELQQP